MNTDIVLRTWKSVIISDSKPLTPLDRFLQVTAASGRYGVSSSPLNTARHSIALFYNDVDHTAETIASHHPASLT